MQKNASTYITPVNNAMTHQRQQRKIKNGENSFAAVNISAIQCKSVITIFYFCCFWCFIMPL